MIRRIALFVPLLLIFLVTTAFAFRPGPYPGFPVFTISPEAKGKLEVAYLEATVTIVDSQATGTASFAFVNPTKDPLVFSLEMSGLRQGCKLYRESLPVSLGSEQSNIPITLKPGQITSYRIELSMPTSHVFSGPPGPWKRGQAFTLEPLLRYDRYGQDLPAIRKLHLRLSAPAGFEAPEQDEWELIPGANVKVWVCKGIGERGIPRLVVSRQDPDGGKEGRRDRGTEGRRK